MICCKFAATILPANLALLTIPRTFAGSPPSPQFPPCSTSGTLIIAHPETATSLAAACPTWTGSIAFDHTADGRTFSLVGVLEVHGDVSLTNLFEPNYIKLSGKLTGGQ